MTREEAIRILDPETTREAMAEIEYYGGFSGRASVVQAVLDACVLAVSALREQEERSKPKGSKPSDVIREKLVELIESARYWGSNTSEEIADHLISNSVTVQEWISVTERLPKLIPCSAGTAYSEAVNVLTTGRKVLTAIYDGNDFIADAEFWDADGEEITHWTPVLLPLPEPPKENDR